MFTIELVDADFNKKFVESKSVHVDFSGDKDNPKDKTICLDEECFLLSKRSSNPDTQVFDGVYYDAIITNSAGLVVATVTPDPNS